MIEFGVIILTFIVIVLIFMIVAMLFMIYKKRFINEEIKVKNKEVKTMTGGIDLEKILGKTGSKEGKIVEQQPKHENSIRFDNAVNGRLLACEDEIKRIKFDVSDLKTSLSSSVFNVDIIATNKRIDEMFEEITKVKQDIEDRLSKSIVATNQLSVNSVNVSKKTENNGSIKLSDNECIIVENGKVILITKKVLVDVMK